MNTNHHFISPSITPNPERGAEALLVRGFPFATVDACIGVESSGTPFFDSCTFLYLNYLVLTNRGIDPGSPWL